MKKFLIIFVSVSGFLISAAEDRPQVVPLALEVVARPGEALSKGFQFEETSFDPDGEFTDLKSRNGVVYQSFRPGNVWHGKLPDFIPAKIEIGGEEILPCTDVYEDERFLYAHYGLDHYHTRAISVIDANRKERIRFTAFSVGDISRVVYDPKDEVLFFTTLEGNLDGAEKARLHAFGIKEEKLLWSSESGTAHGDFELFERHLVSKYGFTGVDDFIFVIDRGSGKTLKKKKIKTAADAILVEKNQLVVPCYKGVLTFGFKES